MKKLLCVTLAICMLFTLSTTALATTKSTYAHVTSELPNIMTAVISAPDMFYVPSFDVSDYYTDVTDDGTYLVLCEGAYVGEIVEEPDGRLTYKSDRAPINQPLPAGVNAGGRRLPIFAQSQIGMNDCWSTVCAMVVNYLTDYNIISADVLNLIYGGANKPASWTEMKRAYNHYGLYPVNQLFPMTFSNVVDRINAGDPVHIGCLYMDGDTVTDEGHSMLIVGYFEGTTNYYYVNDPWEGKLLTEADSGGATQTFMVDGRIAKWTETRYNFV